MRAIPIVGFAAYSGVGKTTLLEKVIRELRERGLRLAVLKHDGHDFDIDHEGKDSWRFAQAGAQITIVSSAKRTAYVENRTRPFAQLLSMVHDVDLVLVEGYKEENITQIGLAREAARAGFAAELDRYAAIVTDMEVSTARPSFSFEDIQGITEFIIGNMDRFTCFYEAGPPGEMPQDAERADA